MGGRGSGYYIRWGTKPTTEAQKRIDIRFLKKQGWLAPGAAGTISWTCSGKPDGDIRFRTDVDKMVLDYKYRVNHAPWQPIEQVVRFDWTLCHFGGRRQWFLCPRCDRRIAVLYGAGKLFLCRHCHGLTYASKQEQRHYRLLRRARKLKERLGVHDPLARVIAKPKGMHHRTFFELRLQIARFERLGWREAAASLGIPTGSFF